MRLRVQLRVIVYNLQTITYSVVTGKGAVKRKGRIQGKSVVEVRNEVQAKGLVNGEGVVW